MTHSQRRFAARQGLLLGASLGALMLSATVAHGQGNTMFTRHLVDPAAQAARAVQNQSSRATDASAIAQRTMQAFARAAAARDAANSAQAAARVTAAASQAAVAVRNGLGEGGLKVAPGVTFDPGAITANDDPRLSQGNLWIGARGPTQTNDGGQTNVTIEQTEQKAILNWETFNVGKDTSVYFDQRAGGTNASEWIALNRITDPSGDLSKIFGSIKAEGQVYLINRNGILFGGTSRINTHSIVASSLDFFGETIAIRNRKFVDGLLFDPTLQSAGPQITFGDAADDVPVADSAVRVAPGAQLVMGQGGRAILAGPEVTNAGTISSPDGQVALAGGRQVQLAINIVRDQNPFGQIDLDPDLRGVIVGLPLDTGGSVENSGAIYADRGNITLQGLNVRQAGLLQATTSATANGSITLTAGDGKANFVYPLPLRYGDLTFATGSTTQILPDDNGEKAVGFDQFRPSRIRADARGIIFEDDSTLYAPSANVSFAATSGQTASGGSGIGRFYLGEGARIDLAGLDIDVSIEQNTIQGELRANELRDNPVLRDSLLRGRKVYFDARRGTELADLTGYYDLIERDVTELMTTGGTLQILGDEIITRDGSGINLSGGSLGYAGGFVRSTQLIDAAGNIIAIEDAKKGVDYIGVYGDTLYDHARWGVKETFISPFFQPAGRYQPGYVEGRSAGSLTLDRVVNFGESDSFRILDGEVVADLVVGQFQRQAPAGATAEDVVRVAHERPQGATLNFSSNYQTDRFSPLGGNITIGSAEKLADDFGFDTALDPADAFDHHLSVKLFDHATFGVVNLTSGISPFAQTDLPGGILTIAANTVVDVGDFGRFTFNGSRADIDGGIRGAGGSVVIAAIQVNDQKGFAGTPSEARPSITLGGDAVIDVAGHWINDFADRVERPPLAIDGGDVKLVSVHDVRLIQGSLIDVSGGGHLAADGESLTPGDGGSITLVTNINSALAPRDGKLTLDGDLRGYALGRGGALTISTGRSIVIGNNPILADGRLGAGEPAPIETQLASDQSYVAGSEVPFPYGYTISLAEPGEAVSQTVTPNVDFNTPLAVEAEFLVPGESSIYTVDGNAYFSGDTIPADAEIQYWGGELPTGYVVPADAFPNGIPIQPFTISRPAGVTDRDVVIPAGTVVAKGMSLDRAVDVVAPLNLAPSFFGQGGFADMSVGGGGGVTVTAGTVIEPDTQGFLVSNAGREIATGSHLFGSATIGAKPEALALPTSLTLGNAWTDAITGTQGVFATDPLAAGNPLGSLAIETGAQIMSRPASIVRLSGGLGVSIDGRISAPGGAIAIDVGGAAPVTSFDFSCFCSVVVAPGRPGVVRLGENAELLARGYAKTSFDGLLERRSVEVGGTVNINSNVLSERGAGQFVLTDPNSLIDVSGISGIADLRAPGGAAPGAGSATVERTVAGAAGRITIQASEGVLTGRLALAPGDETGRGGMLVIENTVGGYTFEGGRSGAPVMTVTQSLTDAIAGMATGPVDPSMPGLVVVADRLNDSQADDLVLRTDLGSADLSSDFIAFDGNVSLRSRRSIDLDAAVLTLVDGARGNVSVRSGHVRLGGALSNFGLALPVASSPDPSGTLSISADLIDISYGLNLGCGEQFCIDGGVGRGFGNSSFVSSGDIRLIGSDVGFGILSAGKLFFDAAQVFAAASTQRIPGGPGFLIESDRSVTFRGNGAAAPMPLSFGAKLVVRAPSIVQGGVLRAPFGEISLEGGKSVILTPGSLTSVSLEGLVVPYGSTPAGVFDRYLDINSRPVKNVNLAAPAVTVADGATIDVSGGGDLLGSQFVPGNGGSTNILENQGYYAIVPGLGAPPADILATTLFDTKLPNVGDTVYLDGITGLPAGQYTLLPASFAVLEGALLVRPEAGGYAASPEAITRPDGGVLVGGYRAVAGTPIRDSDFSRFLVLPNKVWRQFSQIETYSYNGFVDAQSAINGVAARAGRDAGSVILGATQNLVLDGTGKFAAAEGGLLGNLDISAQKIAIVGGLADAPDEFLAIDARKVSAFGAGSILIGGVRSQGTLGTNVQVNASDVIVTNDASSALYGPEIIIAATGNVTIARGATITATGTVLNSATDLIVPGDGALMRITNGDRVDIVRPDASGLGGVLEVGAGAKLSAAGSLSLDAAQTLLLDPAAEFAAGKLDLSSVVVSVGDVPAGLDGTVLSGTTLANLGTSADLLIRGSRSIDLYGSFALGRRSSGAATLGALTLDTPLVRGVAGRSEMAALTAGRITLQNSGSAGDPPPVDGLGQLALDADRLVVGSGDVRIAGFRSVTARAGTLQAVGKGGLDVAAPMAIATDVVTAAAGSDYALRVAGDLSLTSAGGTPAVVTDFGGRLSISGDSVTVDTLLDLPAGIVEITATQGNLMLGEGANILTRGRAVDFRDVVRFVGGGTVRLGAAGGMVMAGDARVDVSGDARGGDAGWVEINAGGAVDLSGAITGTAAQGYRSGGFMLDAGLLADFGALNATLEEGGLNTARLIHVATGELTLAGGQTLTAHDVLLRTDAGSVSIGGTIEASGTDVDRDGGTIRLIGGNNVTLGGTANLSATAASAPEGGFDPDSGLVEIAAVGGSIDVASGAGIAVVGGRQGGGQILFRARRVGDDIAISRLDGRIEGARDVGVAGVQTYQAGELDATLRDTMLADAGAWMGNAGAIKARLGSGQIEVRPGVTVESTGDLVVSTDIDLADARYGQGAPGYLDLRAAGDITLGAALSDGFSSSARDATLNGGRSWSYAIETGRDVVIGAGALVRTGTGAIRVDAGRDLILQDNLSALYTAGSRTATASGFTLGEGVVTGDFPTAGGDISLSAGRDILAPTTTQSSSGWLFRYGDTNWTGNPNTSTVAQQTSWSIVFRNFEQGIGALGGGSVDVRAGRDATHLAIALPTTGHMVTRVGGVATADDVVVRGGGDLDLRAGRDVKGGVFLLGRGEADVTADGALTIGDALTTQRDSFTGTGDSGFDPYTPKTLAALFGLMDAKLSVQARSGAEIEAVFDPMLQGQICENAGCSPDAPGRVTAGSAFYSMTERTGMTISSASGDVRYDTNPWASVDLTRGTAYEAIMLAENLNDLRPQTNGAFLRAPGSIGLSAVQGDLVLASKQATQPQLTLAPSQNGNLELITSGIVRTASNGFFDPLAQIEMLDVAPDYRRGAQHAFLVNDDTRMNLRIDTPTAATNYDRGFRLNHGADLVPARIYAMGGSLNLINATLPKPANVYAGIDLGGGFQFQNNRPSDISSLTAGRDVVSLIATVTGVGDVAVEAGRDIVLAPYGGVISAGQSPNRGIDSTRNLALPENQGANILIFAGAARPADYDGFASVYLDPQNGAEAVRTYLPELTDFMKGLGFDGLSGDELVATFAALPLQSRSAFLQTVFFTELQQTGIDVTDPESPRFQNYKRGYDAISRLFTTDTETLTGAERANIILNSQQVETQAGGNITVLAPYGRIEVGSSATDAQPGQGGLVTRKGGDIRMMADQNIDLFTSRVFTLLGGDVTMWTSNGDITAGAGAKTSVFRPPLTYTLDNDGNVSINVFGLQTGAGIGVLDAGGTGTRENSRLDLIAPRGEVNAGDAGIRVVGDLNIAALTIVGLDNIQVSGESNGLPEIVQVNVGALTTASAASSAVVKEATRLAERTRPDATRDIPTIVNVRFVGFGEE